VRILQIYDLSGGNDGPGHQMARLRSGLEARGHEVRLFTSRVQAAPGPRSDYEAFGTEHPKGQAVSQALNPSASRVLRGALDEFRPDVVHVRQFLWQLSPLILPVLRDVPAVYHVCHYKAVCPVATKLLPDGSPCRIPAGRACLDQGCVTARTWPMVMLQLGLFRRWQGVFDRWLALSEAMARRLAAEGIAPVTVVHNAVQQRSPRATRSPSPLVAYAGRLVPAKGVDVLLRALSSVVRSIPEAHLVVAGEGPDEARLRGLADRLELRHHVTFTGHLERGEMEARLEPAWVQVVPSLWDEPFGNVVTEAMVRGVAVIGSDAGGIPEVVRDGIDGRLVPPGDAEALARALLEVLTAPERADVWGAAGRQRALDTFGEARLTDRIEEILADVVAGRS
jgi:glycosyltransferase involved in cell wall biosynthesis